jgi:anti-sigma factor RsiW
MHYDLDTLDDYLHGELDGPRDAAVHAHLEACPDCRTAYDQSAAVRDWLQAAAAADEREFPSLVKARVWETIRAAKPDRFAWLRPWLAVPVVAALAVLGYIELPGLHGAPPAGVAASDLLLEHSAEMSANPLADHGVVVPASTVDSVQPTSTLIESVDPGPIADPASDGN